MCDPSTDHVVRVTSLNRDLLRVVLDHHRDQHQGPAMWCDKNPACRLAWDNRRAA
jgi:hypothetical protein